MIYCCRKEMLIVQSVKISSCEKQSNLAEERSHHEEVVMEANNDEEDDIPLAQLIEKTKRRTYSLGSPVRS